MSHSEPALPLEDLIRIERLQESSETNDRGEVTMDPAADKRLDKVITFLNRGGFQGFTRQELLIPAWHSIAALSNMAEAITNLYVSNRIDSEQAISLLEEIARRASHPKVNPYRRNINDVRDLYKWGYYLEHLNICLGALSRVSLDHQYRALNERVSRHLYENSLRYKNVHADLHARSRMKWPADQAGILYSLWLHDQNCGTSLSMEPITRWFEYMDANAVDESTGLYITEVAGVKKFSGVPRGCALSYLSHYVGRFDPKRAAAIWERYKASFLIRTVVGTGFREYPRDFKHRWTPDSGPILFGLGAAATGIGLSAASTVGDQEAYQAIKKSLDRILGLFSGVENVFGNNLLTRVGTDLLATSIRLNAETKCAWY